MSLIERLNQIYDQDWRMGFLAHTSDTAGEAAREITSLRELVKELREGLEFYADPNNWWNQSPDDSTRWHNANLEGSTERRSARIGVFDDHPCLVRPHFMNDCGDRARALIAKADKALGDE